MIQMPAFWRSRATHKVNPIMVKKMMAATNRVGANIILNCLTGPTRNPEAMIATRLPMV